MMNACVLRMLLIWMPNIANSTCRKVGERLRRPALHVIIIHCGTKSARIAPPSTLTDSYVWFLPKAQACLNSVTRAPKFIPCLITVVVGVCNLKTLLKYSMLHYIVESYPTFFTLLMYTLTPYITELYPILTHCWGIPNPNTLFEVYPTLLLCWGLP